MSEYDRKAKATAGPAADDRYGAGLVAANLSSRIIKADVAGERTRITITRGKTHGIKVGMEGYIKSPGGMLADFQIDQVSDRTCAAFVDVTIDQLSNHLQVVVNPTSKPGGWMKSDVSTRVIAVFVEDGRTKITIARGAAQGVVPNMRGRLVSADGREGEEFTIFSTTDQATAHLVDPNIATEGVDGELQSFELALERVLIVLEEKHPEAIVRLHKVAAATDRLRRLLGQSAAWTNRIPKSAPKPTNAGNGSRETQLDARHVVDATDVGSTRLGPVPDVDDVRQKLPVPFCHGKNESVDGCIAGDLRPYLVTGFTSQVDSAKTNYKLAAESLRLQELMKKEEDLSWVLSLALELVGGHLIKTAAKAVSILRSRGAAALVSSMNGNYLSDNSLASKAEALLAGIDDKAIEGKVKTIFDPLKKAGVAAAKRQAGHDERNAKKENTGFFVTLMDQCDVAFDSFKAKAIAEGTDAHLVVLREAFAAKNHTKSVYEAALADKLARFRASGVLELGRQLVDRGTIGERDKRVIWVVHANGTLSLRYQSAYMQPGHILGDLYAPQPRVYGRSSSASKPELEGEVPREFWDAAIARSEAVWGSTTPIVSEADVKPGRNK